MQVIYMSQAALQMHYVHRNLFSGHNGCGSTPCSNISVSGQIINIKVCFIWLTIFNKINFIQLKGMNLTQQLVFNDDFCSGVWARFICSFRGCAPCLSGFLKLNYAIEISVLQ